MIRPFNVAIAFVTLLPVGAMAGDIIVVKSKDSTSKDIPLGFELEKTKWDGDDVVLWGTIKNRGKTAYRFVSVILTARDDRGAFMGRKTWHAEPDNIGVGQVAYIEGKFVECEKRRPATVEFSVTGEALK